VKDFPTCPVYSDMNAIRITCQKCGRQFFAGSGDAGNEVACPRCAAPIIIPLPNRINPESQAKARLSADNKETLSGYGKGALILAGVSGFALAMTFIAMSAPWKAETTRFVELNPGEKDSVRSYAAEDLTSSVPETCATQDALEQLLPLIVSMPELQVDPFIWLPATDHPVTRAVQPPYRQRMPAGPNTMTVVNRLNTWIGLGVFCRNIDSEYQYGSIQGVQGGGSVTLSVPNGEFYVYWIRQDKPSSRFRQPDPFTLMGGNQRIKKLCTLTIGSAIGETPVEEYF
jgi:hypothetical protein